MLSCGWIEGAMAPVQEVTLNTCQPGGCGVVCVGCSTVLSLAIEMLFMHKLYRQFA